MLYQKVQYISFIKCLLLFTSERAVVLKSCMIDLVCAAELLTVLLRLINFTHYTVTVVDEELQIKYYSTNINFCEVGIKLSFNCTLKLYFIIFLCF
jgi:hypothetical protein